MSEENLPLKLYKANMQLQLELTRLLQEGTHRWIEAAHERGSRRIEHTQQDIEDLMDAANWQTAAVLPAETFWRLHQHGVNTLQTHNRLAVKNQVLFVIGVQQALAGWQKSMQEAMGQEPGTQPVLEMVREWTATWAAPQMQEEEPAEKPVQKAAPAAKKTKK